MAHELTFSGSAASFEQGIFRLFSVWNWAELLQIEEIRTIHYIIGGALENYVWINLRDNCCTELPHSGN